MLELGSGLVVVAPFLVTPKFAVQVAQARTRNMESSRLSSSTCIAKGRSRPAPLLSANGGDSERFHVHMMILVVTIRGV